MCPSSRVTRAVENEHWADEGIFMSLLNFKSGKPLPWNVSSDVNPYQYKPSDLPAELWYLCSEVKKEAECGFWLETCPPREVFSNSAIRGFRTTLQFYEGRAPHGRKTDWVMQEYTITEKHNNNTKDFRALCRVFIVDENTPPLGKCIANIDVKISINMENTKDSDTGPPLILKSPKYFLDRAAEMDCILMGDYFELNELIEPGSPFSSSSNSSCLTMTSEEYFDSMALLQELDDAITDQEMKESSAKLNLSTPIMSKKGSYILPLQCLRNVQECKPFTQETSVAGNRNKSTSNGFDPTSSSSFEVS